MSGAAAVCDVARSGFVAAASFDVHVCERELGCCLPSSGRLSFARDALNRLLGRAGITDCTLGSTHELLGVRRAVF
eukprot:14499367-Alexandrium_andersonii.AAC.1